MKHIGLSECSPADVRRANAVHPIAALEMEWSLFSRDAEVCLVSHLICTTLDLQS